MKLFFVKLNVVINRPFVISDVILSRYVPRMCSKGHLRCITLGHTQGIRVGPEFAVSLLHTVVCFVPVIIVTMQSILNCWCGVYSHVIDAKEDNKVNNP